MGLSNLFFSDINTFKGPGSVTVFSPTPGLAIVPVANTSLDGTPGGVPLYKDGHVVGGIGVTGVMVGAWLIDADGKLLRPPRRTAHARDAGPSHHAGESHPWRAPS